MSTGWARSSPSRQSICLSEFFPQTFFHLKEPTVEKLNPFIVVNALVSPHVQRNKF